ncbi:MAG: AraC family transcriptional regulator, partial [Sphingorhabdus sp.]
IWSNTPHSFRARGAVAFLFIAPESAVGRGLERELFAGRAFVRLAEGHLASMLEELRNCMRDGFAEDEMRGLGKKIIGTLPAVEDHALPDPRARAMIAYARQNLDETISLPAAASHVGLSHSRARHLFVAQTGLPFKTYVLWARLERAVALYAQGSSLTKAAHTAGFADSAHLSRTFRRTFGLPAAALRLNHD